MLQSMEQDGPHALGLADRLTRSLVRVRRFETALLDDALKVIGGRLPGRLDALRQRGFDGHDAGHEALAPVSPGSLT
jgi:hypothetical protein